MKKMPRIEAARRRMGHGIGITEPGIDLVGELGVRLEEIVMVTEGGGQPLSALGRDVWVI